MTRDELSAHALDCLRTAGWSAGRHVDITNHLAALEADGYQVPETVRDFLREFAGLRLTYPHHRDPAATDHCHFDAATATAGIDPDWVGDWSDVIGADLCPIGQAFSDHMTLTMTPDGQVYAGYDSTLVHVAATPHAAITALCDGQEPRKIDE